MKHKIFLSFFLLTGITSLHAQQPAFISDSLDMYIQREMQRWNIPGVAVAIVKGNNVITKGYGVTNLETKQKVDESTLFMIASNTKIFTGTSLALLNYQGRLSLEDPVKRYLPYFKMYNDTLTGMVTLEDILSHRMGFETFQGDFYNWNNNATRKEIIQNMAKNKPAYQFRDTWGYCNAGFVAAGEVVHAVTDTTWEDFIIQHFFRPLEMNRSSVSHEKIVADKNACIPYTLSENTLVKLNYDNINNIGPCASINSCVKDLSHWLQLQLYNGTYKGKEIFPAEVIHDTRLPRSVVGDGHSGLFNSQHFDLYGLGIGITDYEGREILSHTGGADGFVTSVCFIPEDTLGIVVLTNTDANYFFLAAMYQIMEAYFGLPYRNLSATYYNFFERNNNEKNKQETALKNMASSFTNKTDIKKFTGKYKNDVYGEMEIKQEGGEAVMYFSHHPQLKGKLQQITESSFVCTYNPISWGMKEIPFTIENGKVKSLFVSVNDFIDFGVYEFKKE